MACMNAHGLSNSLLISSIRIRKSIFQSRKTQTNGGDWCQIYIKPNICSICIPPHPFKKRKKKGLQSPKHDFRYEDFEPYKLGLKISS